MDCVHKIGAVRGRAAAMARIKFDEAAKRTPTEPNLRRMFDTIAKQNLLSELESDKTVAIHEQPFLSPLAWAYFSAYQSVVLGAYMDGRILADGVEDAGRFLNRGYARDLLKVTLPHQSEFI
jgi:hypothetical protein